ncbi:hypothetical protein [Bradyrhizobium sp.]
MGVIISAADRPTSYGIVPVLLRLECDARTGFFCRGRENFEHPDGYIGAHADAMAAGWLERNGPQGRIWLCGACSGKKS